MLVRHDLSLAEADRIARQAEADASARGVPVAIAVVDSSGFAITVRRMDGAPAPSAQGSVDKAQTAALTGRPTKFFEEMINGGRISVLKLPLAGPLEGGVPIVVKGQCVGAVGIGGAMPDIDALIASSAAASFVED